jgi:transposase
MMGRLNQEQGRFFYSFCLDEVVPDDHRVREIAGVLDLSWVRAELASYYSTIGRPSIDPVLMIRMLILGYVFAIRSERAICREVQVNLAYRWFCGLSIEDSGIAPSTAESGHGREMQFHCEDRSRCRVWQVFHVRQYAGS